MQNKVVEPTRYRARLTTDVRPRKEPTMIAPGFYFGTCTNSTVNVTARIALALDSGSHDLIPGTLGIYGELAGGGDFTATSTCDSICFTTHEPKHKISIVWQGVLRNRKFEGSYKVTASGLMMRVMGLGHQVGTWQCELAQDAQVTSFEATDDTRFTVRSKNGIEGPFRVADFVDLIIRGHWDHDADVSLNGRSTWIPIGVIVDALSQNTPASTQHGEFWPDVGKDVARKVVSGFAATVILGIFGINTD
jgi:hypothetical protein